MTLQDYIDQIRRVLDEYDVDISFWSDEELTDWLNEAQHQVAKIAKHLTERAYIEPTDENEYPLPVDFIEEYKIKINDEYRTAIPMVDDGEEEGYYIWGDTIYLSLIGEDSKLTLYYYRVPQEMTSPTDEPEIPLHYQRILIPYVLYRAFMKDEKSNLAQLNNQEFNQRAKIMKRKLNNEPNKLSWQVER